MYCNNCRYFKDKCTYTKSCKDKEILDSVYNKAIDDFVEYANTMPTVENDDGEIRPMWLEEMAEHLKENRNNVNE